MGQAQSIPGPQGDQGDPGKDGKNGVGIESTDYLSGTNQLVLKKTDGTTFGPISLKGLNGKDGSSVKTASVTPEGMFSIETDAGIKFGPFNIKGPQGLQGIQGIPGETLGPMGTGTIEFGRGIGNKHESAGKIGYNTWQPNALNIVGSGTDGDNRRVYVYDHLEVRSGLKASGQDVLTELNDLKNVTNDLKANAMRKDKKYAMKSIARNALLRAWDGKAPWFEPTSSMGLEEQLEFKEY
jgi:hypothetical protein